MTVTCNAKWSIGYFFENMLHRPNTVDNHCPKCMITFSWYLFVYYFLILPFLLISMSLAFLRANVYSARNELYQVRIWIHCALWLGTWAETNFSWCFFCNRATGTTRKANEPVDRIFLPTKEIPRRWLWHTFLFVFSSLKKRNSDLSTGQSKLLHYCSLRRRSMHEMPLLFVIICFAMMEQTLRQLFLLSLCTVQELHALCVLGKPVHRM